MEGKERRVWKIDDDNQIKDKEGRGEKDKLRKKKVEEKSKGEEWRRAQNENNSRYQKRGTRR